MVAWRAYDLDVKDYLIFLSLERSPHLSNHAIGKEVGLSSEAVRLRRQQMKSKGFLRPDKTIVDPILGEREQTEAESVYSPNRLGLERNHVILKGLPDRSKLNAVKTICNEHPYTHYRVTSYADGASLYTQFDVPLDAREAMQDFYNRLQASDLVDDVIVQTTLFNAETEADFKSWDVEHDKWQLEYGTKSIRGERQSRIENMWSSFLNTWDKKPLEPIQVELVHDFDILDMKLLREISINSHPNLRELGDQHNKDPTTISRRLKRLKNKVAPNEVLYYDRSVFDLTYPQLITGSFKTNSELDAASLYGFIESGAIPFLCKASFDEETFMIYLTTPPSFAPEFSEFIWEHASNVCVYQLQLDSSFTYYFYYKNYVDGAGWKTEKHYLIDEPLQAI